MNETIVVTDAGILSALIGLLAILVAVVLLVWWVRYNTWHFHMLDKKYTAFEMASLRMLEGKLGIDTDKEMLMLKLTETNRFRKKLQDILLAELEQNYSRSTVQKKEVGKVKNKHDKK